MRTAINILLILVVGLAIGFGLRAYRSATTEDTVAQNGDAPDTTQPPLMNDQRPTRLEPPPKPDLQEGDDWLQSFELTERSGQTVSSESLIGQPYVVSFFFTLCPSICIKQNQKLQELQEGFAGQDVKFLSISVDPETDTPEKLREYAARFGADPEQWLFLTSDKPHYVERVGAEVFQVSANLQHTERFILVNSQGEMDGIYLWSEPRSFERLKQDIAAMLAAEKAQPDAA